MEKTTLVGARAVFIFWVDVLFGIHYDPNDVAVFYDLLGKGFYLLGAQLLKSTIIVAMEVKTVYIVAVEMIGSGLVLFTIFGMLL